MQSADKHSHDLSCDQERLVHVPYPQNYTKQNITKKQ